MLVGAGDADGTDAAAAEDKLVVLAVALITNKFRGCLRQWDTSKGDMMSGFWSDLSVMRQRPQMYWFRADAASVSVLVADTWGSSSWKNSRRQPSLLSVKLHTSMRVNA